MAGMGVRYKSPKKTFSTHSQPLSKGKKIYAANIFSNTVSIKDETTKKPHSGGRV
jgi:hypothetical protein